MRSRRVALALTLAVAACSSRAPSDGASPANSRFEMGEVQFAEARAVGITNVAELVARYHPEWLRAQQVGGRTVAVSGWLDRTRLGNAAALASVPLASVIRVRYLSPSEAQGELGMDNQGGAIVAYTR